MKDDGFGPGLALGLFFGVLLSGSIVDMAHENVERTTEAIERRGYDVEVLAAEKAEDYWRAVAARRPVVDPQPTAEIIGGVK
jgi:hypothetical protein